MVLLVCIKVVGDTFIVAVDDSVIVVVGNVFSNDAVEKLYLQTISLIATVSGVPGEIGGGWYSVALICLFSALAWSHNIV